jgi:Co/Zn/Cd efflux system component
MDCPSEEQLIRMKLSDLDTIEALEFDIPNRQLAVLHSGPQEAIFRKLEELKFDTSLIESVDEEKVTLKPVKNTEEKRLLKQVLGINFFFFILEITTGYYAKSMGIVADGLDMLADSLVYGLALWAIGGSLARKRKIALTAGLWQLLLALLAFAEVIRRFTGLEELPSFQTMIGISVLALMGNGLSLYLLQRSKSKEVHMKASLIFTSNDVIVNLGVILAGVLVYLTGSRYPDLIVGAIVLGIVGRGAVRIVRLR